MELRYLDIIGKQAKDTVTGYSGTITAVTEWMNGCVRLTIQPNKVNKEGKTPDAEWFDAQQVIVEEKRKKGIVSKAQQLAQAATPSGGPRNDPPEW